MRWAIDYDGTITSNYAFYTQLCSMLMKSGYTVVILTGCNPKRLQSVKDDLKSKGIPYHFIISRPSDVISGPHSIGKWKKKTLQDIQASHWIDNEIKNYEDAGITFENINTLRA